MNIMIPFRFYVSAALLTENQTNREDSLHVKPLMVENNTIPTFQIAIPYTPGVVSWEFKIYDDDDNETDLTGDITVFEDVRVVEGVPTRYITHAFENVTYDAGCYTARFIISGGSTFYSVKFRNFTSDYTETFFRKIDVAGNVRLIGTTDKRITQ